MNNQSDNKAKMTKDSYFNIDDRWEALCYGELNDIEKQKLKSSAKDDALTSALYQGFEPLDDNFKSSVTDNLLKQISSKEGELPQKAPVPIIRRIMRAFSMTNIQLPAAAAAACLVLVFSYNLSQQSQPMHQLPAFNAVWPEAIKTLRSTDAGAQAVLPEYLPDQNLRVILRPEKTLAETLTLLSAAKVDQQNWQILPVKAQQSKTGSFKVTWSAATQGLDAGEREIALLIFNQADTLSKENFLTYLNSNSNARLQRKGRLLNYRYRIKPIK